MKTIKPKHTDEYISGFPTGIQKILQGLRSTIRKAAPGAVEIISYNMPAYQQHGILVYFAACNNHIGFYPTSSPIRAFKNELADYKTSKGAIQFSIDKPLPDRLITKIVKFKLKENISKHKLKSK